MFNDLESPPLPPLKDAVASAVRASVSRLAELGAEVVEVSVPYLDQHCASYYVNVLSEASANLARYDGMRYGLRVRDPPTAKSAMLDSRGKGFGEVRTLAWSLPRDVPAVMYRSSQRPRSAQIPLTPPAASQPGGEAAHPAGHLLPECGLLGRLLPQEPAAPLHPPAVLRRRLQRR
jgi:Asp-tRNA(Asn)/Glu-tRNA(Gln) amidotransferase A subunit family amidase